MAPHETVGLLDEVCISCIVATSVGGSFLSELDGDCTFIFQSNNQTTSPFSGAPWRRGGRLQTQPLMHLRPIYCADIQRHCSVMKATQSYLLSDGQAQYRSKLGTGNIRDALKQSSAGFFICGAFLNERYFNRHKSLNTVFL